MLLAPIINEKFKYEHLLASPKNLKAIQQFFVEKQTGKGLERYIKKLAESEEYVGRTGISPIHYSYSKIWFGTFWNPGPSYICTPRR